MKTSVLLLRAVLALALLVSSTLLAAPPPGILNHQGRIAVSGANYTGTGHFKFALVDAAGTATLWSNNNSSTGGGQPTAAVGDIGAMAGARSSHKGPKVDNVGSRPNK